MFRKSSPVTSAGGAVRKLLLDILPVMNQHPDTPDFPSGVSQPAIRALSASGFSSVTQLEGLRGSDLLKLHGVGPKAIRIISQALIDMGLKPLRP